VSTQTPTDLAGQSNEPTVLGLDDPNNPVSHPYTYKPYADGEQRPNNRVLTQCPDGSIYITTLYFNGGVPKDVCSPKEPNNQ
jgi:hypothetical protein